MIIDFILDRKDLEEQLEIQGKNYINYVEWYDSLSEQNKAFATKPYDAHDFYFYALDEGAYDITRAMDEGEEDDVKAALCDYVLCNGYDEQICDYINSVKWVG